MNIRFLFSIEMLKRTISFMVLLLILLIFINLEFGYEFLAILSLIYLIAINEFTNIIQLKNKISFFLVQGLLILFIYLLSLYIENKLLVCTLCVFSVIFSVFIVINFIYKKLFFIVCDSFKKKMLIKHIFCCFIIIPQFLSVCYAKSSNNIINELAINFAIVFAVIFDSLSFLFGNFFGKNKFISRISPGKTIEGYFGSIIFMFIIIVYFNVHYYGYYEGLNTKLFGKFFFITIFAIFAIIGDLFISQIKRIYSIKNSGNLIPGHGGILDRLDTFIFLFPASLIYFNYMF